MQQDHIFSPELEIETDTGAAPWRFETPKAVLDRIEREERFYEQIIAKEIKDPAVGEAWNSTRQQFKPLRAAYNNGLTNSSTTSEFKSHMSALTKSYQRGSLIRSDHPVAILLAHWAETDSAIAVRALLIFIRARFSIAQSPLASTWLRAGAVAEALSRGWLDQKPAIDASLTDFQNEWFNRFAATEKTQQETLIEQAELVAQLTEIKEAWGAGLKNISGESKALNEELKTSTSDFIATAKSDVEQFKQAYNSELALRAPARYWTFKAWAHRGVASMWLLLFSLGGAAGVMSVWYVWHMTVELSPKEITYYSYIPTLGTFIFAIWVLRLFSRQLISNLALSADASERVAMVKTFLALVEGNQAKDTDKAIILKELFRSSLRTTDDLAPPTILDIGNITKAIKGGG
jgi:hypothetical protein